MYIYLHLYLYIYLFNVYLEKNIALSTNKQLLAYYSMYQV